MHTLLQPTPVAFNPGLPYIPPGCPLVQKLQRCVTTTEYLDELFDKTGEKKIDSLSLMFGILFFYGNSGHL